MLSSGRRGGAAGAELLGAGELLVGANRDGVGESGLLPGGISAVPALLRDHSLGMLRRGHPGGASQLHHRRRIIVIIIGNVTEELSLPRGRRFPLALLLVFPRQHLVGCQS